MKKLGLVGGISWTSTLDYYKYINEGINQELGGLESAELILYSLNFGAIQNVTWVNAIDLIYNACEKLVNSGAEAIVLCANTAHIFADEIQSKIDIPLIHIASATAEEIRKQNLNKVGLLGTKFTMEMDFYRDKLKEKGIETIIPSDKEAVETIQDIIKNELGKGIVNKGSKIKFMRYAHELLERGGAEGIILGCTEIPLLISQADFSIPVFDTTKIHAQAAIKFALS